MKYCPLLFSTVHRRKFSSQLIAALLLFPLTFFYFSKAVSAQEAETETEDPVAIFNQGQEAHERGELQKAIALYEKALELAPEFPEAEYQRGGALLSLKKSDEAEKAFRRAIELRSDWSLPMASLGALLIQKNQLIEAERILTKAVQLDAQNFPALAALTELRLKTKAKPEILQELLDKIKALTAKANPTVTVWAARAALENALGDRSAAKASAERALADDPQNQNALMTRADIALSEGDTRRAAEINGKLAQFLPNLQVTKILQAKLLIADGKSDEALKILEAVVNPNEEVLSLREKIAAGDSTDAAELEKQLAKDGENAALLGRLCALRRVDDPGKALEFCRRASEAEPDNINHAIGFGAALVQAKRYAEAVNLFRRLLASAPDNFTARANLATALFQLKRFPEAKTEYRWLTEKQPELAIGFYFLAITHDQLDEYLDAMANYQQFLRLSDAQRNRLEIEKVNLRLPVLQKLIKEKKGKKS